MQVLNASAETERRVDHLFVRGGDNTQWHKSREEAFKAVIAEANCPIEPGSLDKVDYDTKTDRYVLCFIGGGKTIKVRAAHDVAQFVLEHTGGRYNGYWRLRMENGIAIDAVLVTF